MPEFKSIICKIFCVSENKSYMHVYIVHNDFYYDDYDNLKNYLYSDIIDIMRKKYSIDDTSINNFPLEKFKIIEKIID